MARTASQYASPRSPSALVVRPHGGRQALLSDELEALHRRRLRGFAGVTLFAVGLAIFLGRTFPTSQFRHDLSAFIGLHVTAAVLAVQAAFLFSRWPRTLARLRTLELLFFGTITVQMALGHLGAFRHGLPAGIEHTTDGPLIFVLMTGNQALRWFALIVAYGTFIPNTGPYCTGLVVGMATTPLAVLVVLASQ